MLLDSTFPILLALYCLIDHARWCQVSLSSSGSGILRLTLTRTVSSSGRDPTNNISSQVLGEKLYLKLLKICLSLYLSNLTFDTISIG